MEVLLDTCARRRVASLLLLILLAVKAAAECSKPEAKENTVLTDQSLLLNTFSEGVEVYFECANGYVVESGSGKITCAQKNWSESDLICKKKDCGFPESRPNMLFDLSTGTLFGNVIRVFCDKGFQLSGSSYKQCYATGWSGSAKCNIVSCDAPPEVLDGRISWDSQDEPKYGEVIEYVCKQGFTLIGNSSIMCGEDGEYDSPAPSCEGVRTEERITTATASPTSTPPQEVSPSTESPASLTDKTTSATRTVSPSKPGTEKILQTRPSVRSSVDKLLGTTRVRGMLTVGSEATTTTETPTTSSSLQEEHGGAVDTHKDIGYTPVIISVICVSLVGCIFALCLHKFLLKRKGSYDTREDLKPELLQFQNPYCLPDQALPMEQWTFIKNKTEIP
uniref:complement decay-accelerating factor isoform X2 n=1 Tax=Gasterosteus aculeatus aculeatus TaxID=481459 RepID=UPI001A998396|nr:complement decay-accelerating factor isoform X2 [Gasterosteus aculeatus aculeatus]